MDITREKGENQHKSTTRTEQAHHVKNWGDSFRIIEPLDVVTGAVKNIEEQQQHTTNTKHRQQPCMDNSTHVSRALMVSMR